MRQGQQQNRRGRGRNNRKGQSPLTRSFESTGPDVKIRGTPAHIGEKYLTLARDAAASGDPVLAENYLQHAEHYNRIIMAAREQFTQGPGEAPNGRFQSLDGDDMDGDDFSDDGDGFPGEGQPRSNDFAPPPKPYEGGQGQNQQRRDDRPFRRNNDFRPRDRQQGDNRHNAQDRHGQNPRFNDRNDRFADRNYENRGAERQQTPPAAESEQPAAAFPVQPRDEAPRRRERYQQTPQHDQPEFLRRPVRRPRRETNGADGDEPAANGAAPATEEPTAD